MKKRMIGLLMALCLIVGLLPVAALAEEATEPAPPVPAELKVTTGDITASIVWKPAMSEGMTPAYAKTTAEGALVLEGASESDYNLKAEWPTGGTPTLTLKNATLANNNRMITETESINTTGKRIDCPETIDFGGTEDFVVLVKGTNTILGRHDTKPISTAAYRSPTGIFADNEGTLTIKGDSKADILHIDNYSGAIVEKTNNALTIENVTFKGDLHNTKSNGQFGIVMLPGVAANNDKMNLTVRNADFAIEDFGKWASNNLIQMGSNKGAAMEACTGDILFQNSKIRLYRSNSASSVTVGTETICFGAGSTMTIDRCDVVIYSRYRTVNYAPTLTNVKNATYASQDLGTQDYNLVAGTKIVTTGCTTIKATHVCGAANDDFDCTTAEKCVMCGETVGTVQTAHKAEDDGDCTTAVACTNEGCKKVITEAKAAHAPAADDGDCTTAVVCTNAGCKKVITEAKASHTSPADRKDCNTPANCTVCNKALVVGQHTGGSATCVAKAKCDVCKAEYGELAACAPAADDGDCTTAIKCTVCDKETTAAKEHKFTNDKDTSCDNEGCKHTRTISSNPNTGDISILLTAAVALSSAVGFAGVSVLRKKEN